MEWTMAYVWVNTGDGCKMVPYEYSHTIEHDIIAWFHRNYKGSYVLARRGGAYCVYHKEEMPSDCGVISETSYTNNCTYDNYDLDFALMMFRGLICMIIIGAVLI